MISVVEQFSFFSFHFYLHITVFLHLSYSNSLSQDAENARLESKREAEKHTEEVKRFAAVREW